MSAHGQDDAASAKPLAKLDFYRDIQPIFQVHCEECHGPKTAKADFRVDDRSTLMSYVAPGDLESSSLWSDYLTTNDAESRMPPEKHNKPLSAVELATLRVWILEGAQWPEKPVVAAATVEPVAAKSTVVKAFNFIGVFHPAVVHFPIALLLISSLFVLLSFVRRTAFEPAAFHLLWMGAAGAVVACVLGWSFADSEGYPTFWKSSWEEHGIARHRIMGMVLALVAVGLTFVAAVARIKDRLDMRVAWLIGSAIVALLVSVVGHQGGELTYGEDLYGRAYNKAFGIEAAPAKDGKKETSPASPVKESGRADKGSEKATSTDAAPSAKPAS